MYRPGDTMTLRILDVERGMLTAEVVATGEQFTILIPADPIRPPTMQQWQETAGRIEGPVMHTFAGHDP